MEILLDLDDTYVIKYYISKYPITWNEIKSTNYKIKRFNSPKIIYPTITTQGL